VFFAHFVCFCAFFLFFLLSCVLRIVRTFLFWSNSFVNLWNLPRIYCELQWYELHNSLLQIEIFSSVHCKCLRPPLYDIFCRFPSYFFANSHHVNFVSFEWFIVNRPRIVDFSLSFFANVCIMICTFTHHIFQFSTLCIAIFPLLILEIPIISIIVSFPILYCELPYYVLWISLSFFAIANVCILLWQCCVLYASYILFIFNIMDCEGKGKWLNTIW